MKTILELTNSLSGYGSLRVAFADDENKHIFGANGDIDFQINSRVIPSMEDITNIDIKEIDEIRIWFCSKNTNEVIFASVIVHIFKEYQSKISLIDLSRYISKPGIEYFSIGELYFFQIIKAQSLQRKLSKYKSMFFKKVIRYYFERNTHSESFMMVEGRRIYELPHSEIKEYILNHFVNNAATGHTIGLVMAVEREKGWYFGDNVIYKFIIDLINEGKILLVSSFNERYVSAPKLFLNNNMSGYNDEDD